MAGYNPPSKGTPKKKKKKKTASPRPKKPGYHSSGLSFRARRMVSLLWYLMFRLGLLGPSKKSLDT